jgi:chromosome partitioning protein
MTRRVPVGPWLNRRKDRPEIHGISAYKHTGANVTRSWQLRMPAHIERTIIDTPAGLTKLELVNQVQGIDTILIPVLPSLLDIQVTADFIRDLLLIGHARSRNIRIGIIANRVKANTLALNRLDNFLRRLNIPVIAYLRDTQRYLHAAEIGTGIHENSSRDATTWETIINWLENSTLPQANGDKRETAERARPGMPTHSTTAKTAETVS